MYIYISTTDQDTAEKKKMVLRIYIKVLGQDYDKGKETSAPKFVEARIRMQEQQYSTTEPQLRKDTQVKTTSKTGLYKNSGT